MKRYYSTTRPQHPPVPPSIHTVVVTAFSRQQKRGADIGQLNRAKGCQLDCLHKGLSFAILVWRSSGSRLSHSFCSALSVSNCATTTRSLPLSEPFTTRHTRPPQELPLFNRNNLRSKLRTSTLPANIPWLRSSILRYAGCLVPPSSASLSAVLRTARRACPFTQQLLVPGHHGLKLPRTRSAACHNR